MRRARHGFVAALFAACGLFPAAHAQTMNVAVNVTNIHALNDHDQDAAIDLLRRNGVHTVRLAVSHKASNERTTRFISNAFAAGIGTLLIVNVTEGGSVQHMRPVDPELHFFWPAPPLTDAEPEGFRQYITGLLGGLDQAGVRLAGFELGNEINNAQFNGDFTRSHASGRVLGLKDLNDASDASAQAIAASYRSYLKIAAVLKDWRDHSQTNQKTPIISAGLVPGLPGPIPNAKVDSAAGADSLKFLKQNGLDRLVDGYGIHIYPSLNPNRDVAYRVKEVLDDGVSECARSKPCWVTEWGFVNREQSCPLNDTVREQTTAVLHDAFKTLADQGKIANVSYYAWIDPQWGIYRCGALTQTGKIALGPL